MLKTASSIKKIFHTTDKEKLEKPPEHEERVKPRRIAGLLVVGLNQTSEIHPPVTQGTQTREFYHSADD